MKREPAPASALPRFDRRFFEGIETFTAIGSGALGGKATGLHAAREVLETRPAGLRFESLEISVPTLTVIGTDVFDWFLTRNGLQELVSSGAPDHHVARAVQAAELPHEIAGDLWALVERVRTPLAVRSSSLLEDAAEHPFAGVYETKMTPNDAHDAETRFQRLVEAVKFVWASTFFQGAREAARGAGRSPDEEKMAVIIQEVVGRRHRTRFYPDVSGVARSYNFYPAGDALPSEGVVNLALGLGKTIVDGERSWTYSPSRPHRPPPFNSIRHMMQETQTEFWAVRMGPPAEYNPLAETEYLVRENLAEAEQDETLPRVASTYDHRSDRMVPGTGPAGPRVLDFAPLLKVGEWPFNESVEGLLQVFRDRVGTDVEIEFALTFPEAADRPARLGFLQVRPMALSTERVEIGDEALADPAAVIRSEHVMGNGTLDGIRDVVFVRRDRFDARHSRDIAAEVDRMNHDLVAAGRPYLLIGFGRWGSADPWLGIPVQWPQISGARAIVEAGLPTMTIEMSQGAHFFHNLISFHVAYFSVAAHESGGINWPWLEGLPRRDEGEWVCRAEAPAPLRVRVDGRSGRGVVLSDGEASHV
jgi:hypothetical protein